jgi:hypothetical protein
MKMTIFWVVAPCSLVEVAPIIGRPCALLTVQKTSVECIVIFDDSPLRSHCELLC